nr:LEF-10 [Calliteara abietis nucleopolyhedrovirus]
MRFSSNMSLNNSSDNKKIGHVNRTTLGSSPLDAQENQQNATRFELTDQSNQHFQIALTNNLELIDNKIVIYVFNELNNQVEAMPIGQNDSVQALAQNQNSVSVSSATSELPSD